MRGGGERWYTRMRTYPTWTRRSRAVTVRRRARSRGSRMVRSTRPSGRSSRMLRTTRWKGRPRSTRNGASSMTWAWTLKGMSPICKVRYSTQPSVQLVALFAASISRAASGLGFIARLSARSFRMATICEPGSITAASVIRPSTRTSISWRGTVYSGSTNEVSLTGRRGEGVGVETRLKAPASMRHVRSRSTRSLRMRGLAARI
jgi:hypothetical protein